MFLLDLKGEEWNALRNFLGLVMEVVPADGDILEEGSLVVPFETITTRQILLKMLVFAKSKGL